MSRKHFEAIAASLRRSGASREVIEEMADTLASFNHLFDRQRFIDAADCKVGRPVRKVAS